MDFQVQFVNEPQKQFFFATERNQLFSGGFNNGKTYIACLKSFILLSSFDNYRMSIGRQVRADLMKSTYQTFFKICPQDMIERNNEQDGITLFKNKSLIYWLHLDKVEKSTLRGLEVNSNLTDQAEETQEETYDVLDSRVGRWDGAIVPPKLLALDSNWPVNPKTGRHVVPSYNMQLCNPDTQFHFLFRKYHPDSVERRLNYFFVEGQWDSSLGSKEAYEEALKHDPEWVDKYVRGVWGRSNAQIHRLPSEAILEPTDELLDRIKRKGNLFRVLDHGDSSPTCCLWFAVLDGVFVCYREYYVPNQIISYHRKSIHELSEGESYSGNYADPSIFHRDPAKKGGFWSIADEYLTRDIPSPPIPWLPADNNEFATRNRINELLSAIDGKCPTGEGFGSKLYFVKKTKKYPNGCYNSIRELQSQRKKLIGYVDGRAYYSDEREDSVTDHSYDCIRYFVSQHGSTKRESRRPIKPMTIAYFRMMRQRTKGLLSPIHGSY